MIEARRAGWTFLLCAVMCGVSAYLFRRAVFGSEVPLVPAMSIFFSWVLIVLCAISLFYAVLGLVCGYSDTAWDMYERSVNEATRRNVLAAWKKIGIDPPPDEYL